MSSAALDATLQVPLCTTRNVLQTNTVYTQAPKQTMWTQKQTMHIQYMQLRACHGVISTQTCRLVPVRRAIRPLVRDVAAVASGMRAAAMLDYLHLDAGALLNVLRPHTGSHLVVAVLDGCPYVINTGVLSVSSAVPRLCVVFDDTDGSGHSVRPATPEQYEV